MYVAKGPNGTETGRERQTEREKREKDRDRKRGREQKTTNMCSNVWHVLGTINAYLPPIPVELLLIQSLFIDSLDIRMHGQGERRQEKIGHKSPATLRVPLCT